MSTMNKTGKVAAISIALTFVAQPSMLAAIDKSCITGAEVDRTYALTERQDYGWTKMMG